MNTQDNWNALYNPQFANTVPSFLNNNLPISKLELSISARNLINMDVMSKSDPMCIVYMKDTSISPDYFEIGRTETVKDNLNPDFVHKIGVDYNFEKVQQLRFEFWDIDINIVAENSKDFLGEVVTTLPEIVSNKSRQFVKPIKNSKSNKKDCGKLIIVCEEVSASKQIAKFKFRINSLKVNSCLSLLVKPSTFLKILRSNEDGSFTVVHETKIKWYTRNPEMDRFEIKVRTLCNSDFDRAIRFDVMDHSSAGDHKLIGSVNTTLNELVKNKGSKFEIKNRNKKVKGELELQDLAFSDSFSFFDYLKGGLELNFAVAIDFTSSNGPVDHPSSLHFIDQMYNRPNSYEIALRSVGQIIQYYNSTKMFPAFGFGARTRDNPQIVSHRFALNNRMDQPYCEGVDSILHHYRETIKTVTLYGPTNFSPIIEYTADIAAADIDKSMSKNYFVLLIITDGVICDLEMTKRSIIRASSLPVSIIIVGVGSADFSTMVELDSDESVLEQDGKRAVRDIVQFVSMQKYQGKYGSIVNMDLARDVLYEIPDQVEAYMKYHEIKPGMKRMSVDSRR